MTATEELRAMLDERGVKYKEFVMGINDGDVVTKFNVGQIECAFYEIEKRTVMVRVWNLTPAQVIEATLGRGECTGELPTFNGLPIVNGKPHCSWCGMEWGVLPMKPSYCPNCGRKVVKK